MSVLIKTMMMPDSCHVCMAGFGGYCFVAPEETDGVCPDHGRADWCPIIELPDHGDVVPVVRCKECKWWVERHPRLGVPWCRQTHLDRGADGYCEMGERSEE